MQDKNKHILHVDEHSGYDWGTLFPSDLDDGRIGYGGKLSKFFLADDATDSY